MSRRSELVEKINKYQEHILFVAPMMDKVDCCCKSNV